jgi:glutaredoxin
VRVTLLYFDGCPNWEATYRHLETLAAELEFELDRHHVATSEEAERLAFRGSPTVLVDGRDPFATGDEPVGLACRVYPTDGGLAGAPTEQQLRDALTAR